MVGIVLTIVLLIQTRPEPELLQVALPPVQVAVVTVELADIQPTQWVAGYLRPAQQARLQFQVTGRLQQRLVEPGQQVEQGAELLRLDGEDYRDLMIEAKATLQQEQAAVERDQKLLQLAASNRALQADEVVRQERLGTDLLGSRSALDTARQRLIQLQSDEERLRFSVNSSAARLDAAQAVARRAKRNWQRATLTAPFAGTVNRVIPQRGDNVAAKEVVLELLDLNQLEFYAELDRATVTQLRRGEVINVHVDGQTYVAHIFALQQHPDPDTYTYALRARFENPGVLSGATAEASLLLPLLERVVLVPVSAVVHDDDATYVFVVEGGQLQRRLVTLGPRQGNTQVLLAGVAPDEQLVSSGGASLSDGLAVQY